MPSMKIIATVFLNKLQKTTICGSQFLICCTEFLLLGYGEKTFMDHYFLYLVQEILNDTK
jgi:hypothetical protein